MKTHSLNLVNEMARPGRVELPTLCLEGRRSIQTELRALN